jgi:hypothetical protein
MGTGIFVSTYSKIPLISPSRNPDNLALEKTSLKTRCFVSTRKLSSTKQVDLRETVKKVPKTVCTSIIVVSLEPLFSYSLNFFSYEDSRKQRSGP